MAWSKSTLRGARLPTLPEHYSQTARRWGREQRPCGRRHWHRAAAGTCRISGGNGDPSILARVRLWNWRFTDEQGRTPLHWCSEEGSLQVPEKVYYADRQTSATWRQCRTHRHDSGVPLMAIGWKEGKRDSNEMIKPQNVYHELWKLGSWRTAHEKEIQNSWPSGRQFRVDIHLSNPAHGCSGRVL